MFLFFDTFRLVWVLIYNLFLFWHFNHAYTHIRNSKFIHFFNAFQPYFVVSVFQFIIYFKGCWNINCRTNLRQVHLWIYQFLFNLRDAFWKIILWYFLLWKKASLRIIWVIFNKCWIILVKSTLKPLPIFPQLIP